MYIVTATLFIFFTLGVYNGYSLLLNVIGASLSEPHTSDSFVGSSFYEYMR